RRLEPSAEAGQVGNKPVCVVALEHTRVEESQRNLRRSKQPDGKLDGRLARPIFQVIDQTLSLEGKGRGIAHHGRDLLKGQYGALQMVIDAEVHHQVELGVQQTGEVVDAPLDVLDLGAKDSLGRV